METVFERTTKSDQEIARKARTQLTKASDAVAKTRKQVLIFQIEGIEQSLKVPKSAVMFFFTILDKMADGNSIALLLSGNNTEVTTQQAAEILGVSRPHIVSLLEKGEIPFKKVGTHRRIRLRDVVTYDQKIKRNRAEKLDFLADQAQELKLGY